MKHRMGKSKKKDKDTEIAEKAIALLDEYNDLYRSLYTIPTDPEQVLSKSMALLKKTKKIRKEIEDL